ncbi:MAG: toll/interleukin-1 receptor domain-containing protein, partial [Gammaproteobacteria bacterium]|nr:toll/interleukin-1 receptor domain-containing protein [Gammaproteobacteria bacterium]
MADLFISYARKDREVVQSLVALLEGFGFSVWWDHHIAGGHAFAGKIEQELNAATAVIVVWSETSVQSDWVL